MGATSSRRGVITTFLSIAPEPLLKSLFQMNENSGATETEGKRSTEISSAITDLLSEL